LLSYLPQTIPVIALASSSHLIFSHIFLNIHSTRSPSYPLLYFTLLIISTYLFLTPSPFCLYLPLLILFTFLH
jgi:hypothetical protein